MRNKINIPDGLYGITGENFANGKSNIQCVKEMIEGGIKIIQYREKKKSLGKKLEEAREIRELCRENQVLFIINDNIDIAILVDADGVHVGQDDISPKDVRKLIGNDKIIGLSTHSPTQAKEAENNPDVDYIGVGPIFPTTTKDTEAVGVEYLEFVVNNLKIPFVAIGGIKDYNIEKIVKLGATRISLVSDIVGASNIVEKIKELKNKLK